MPTGEQPHKKKTMRPKDLPHLVGVERVKNVKNNSLSFIHIHNLSYIVIHVTHRQYTYIVIHSYI